MTLTDLNTTSKTSKAYDDRAKGPRSSRDPLATQTRTQSMTWPDIINKL